MPKASDKQKEKQTEEIMTLDQRLETITKMIADGQEEYKKGQEEFKKEMKSMRDDMRVRDEKLAQAEGEIVHLGSKTRVYKDTRAKTKFTKYAITNTKTYSKQCCFIKLNISIG